MRRPRLLLLLPVLLALVVHAPSLRNGFAYDDVGIVRDNATVTGADWEDALLGAYWQGRGGETDFGLLWRPTTIVAFTAQWAAFDGSPVGFHAVNVVLNAAATFLVALLFLRILGGGGERRRADEDEDEGAVAEAGAGALTPALIGAVVAGSIFAVHPVHVEAVANVVGQAEIVSAICVLVALLLALRHRPGATEPFAATSLRLVGIAVLYLVGLGAKEIAVTLPGLLLLARVVDLRGDLRRAIRVDLGAHLVLVTTLATYLTLRASVLGSVVGEWAAPAFVGRPALDRIWTALSIIPRVWELLIAPVRLAIDYAPNHIRVVSFPALEGWIGVGVAGVLLLLAVHAWRSGAAGRAAALGILWVEVARSPVSNLLIPTGVLLAERTLYLPSVGIALAAGGAAVALLRAGRPLRTVAASALVVVALFAWRTVDRIPVWESTFTVLVSMGNDSPDSWRAYRFLSNVRLDAGDEAGSLEALGHAYEVMPARFGTGFAYAERLMNLGRLDEAEPVIAYLQTQFPHLAQSHHLAARLAFERGVPLRAVREVSRALASTNTMGSTFYYLARGWLEADDLDAAARAHAAALGREIDDPAVRRALADIDRAIRERRGG